MIRKKYGLLLLLVVIALLSVSCTTSSSVGGASIETGYEINDDYNIVSAETAFKAEEEFYFSFYNNDSFNSSAVILQLVDSESDEVLLEHEYEVDPEWNILSDTIWFNEPGKYKIICIINDEIRASQEVIVE